MKPRFVALSIILYVFTQNVGFAQITLPRPTDGKLRETTDAKRAEVTVTVTDKDGKEIPAQPSMFPKTFEFGTASQPTIEIPIPKDVVRRVTGERIDVIDVRQTTKILEESGQTADLMIESVFFDSGTSQFLLGNIFGTLANRVGLNQEVLIPDLFADTTGDGVIGDGDVLFSLVDLNVYLNTTPLFSLGDSFTISNGVVTELPGMTFSTTPFIFDPGSGFSGTPFTGVGVIDAQHAASAVPEPGSGILFGSGILSLLGYVWRTRKQAQCAEVS